MHRRTGACASASVQTQAHALLQMIKHQAGCQVLISKEAGVKNQKAKLLRHPAVQTQAHAQPSMKHALAHFHCYVKTLHAQTAKVQYEKGCAFKGQRFRIFAKAHQGGSCA